MSMKEENNDYEEDGNIVEQGTHEELMKKKGFYEQLYQAQFADMH